MEAIVAPGHTVPPGDRYRCGRRSSARSEVAQDDASVEELPELGADQLHLGHES
jgi:hypothetical protein